MLWKPGRVAELADAKDLGSFGEILAGSTPVAPTNRINMFEILFDMMTV